MDDLTLCEKIISDLDEILFTLKKEKDELADNEKLDIVYYCLRIMNTLKFNEVIS